MDRLTGGRIEHVGGTAIVADQLAVDQVLDVAHE
jgi:hypothetical protein